jgi:hypothetical protein
VTESAEQSRVKSASAWAVAFSSERSPTSITNWARLISSFDSSLRDVQNAGVTQLSATQHYIKTDAAARRVVELV